ncbi:MAG TPA: SDR family oxidoreductase [Mycobacteriales bacterium]|nr:SDR family oxidoreductase [Mycobacteriales bacterium]
MFGVIGMAVATFFVESAGVKLAVHERGHRDAPTVLLVHGYPDTSATWESVAEELAHRFHVVTYDVRGAGESDRPRRKSAYKLDLLAADIRAVADAVSPHAPVHLVGHDWGSVQGWEAITDPEMQSRFASYTSISGPALDHAAAWVRARLTPRGLPAVLKQSLKSWYMNLMHIPGLMPVMWRIGMAKSFEPAVRRIEGLPKREGDAWPAPTLAKDGGRGVLIYRANILPGLRHPRERRTTVPVHVIAPTGDRYISPELATSDLAQWTDRLWVRRVRAGHWVQHKSPHGVAQAITDLVTHLEGEPESRSLRRYRVGEAGAKPAGEFANQLVVVTGAGSGIGRETALAFGRLGAEVVIADLNENAGEETASELRVAGARAHSYQVDVADLASMEDFAKRVVADHGVPDIVVNNAGIGIAGRFLDTTAADWERIVDINLLGVVHGCRLFGAAMADRLEGGYIVNVASAAAFTPSRMLAAYSATKAAVLMLSESISAEFGDYGIGVSAICPGLINTPITTSTRYVGVSDTESREAGKKMAKRYARRNYPPSKVADAIVKAVRERRPVVPVTPEAVGARIMSRLSPGFMRRLARVEVK